MKKRILLVDFANSFFSQYHFKEPDKAWKFLSDIKKIVEQFKVHKVVFACEGGKSKYRLGIYEGYKANREETRKKWDAAELARYARFRNEEMPDCVDLARKVGIPCLSVKGVEADDVISFVVRHVDLEEFDVMVLSTDADMLQLLRPGVAQAGYAKPMIMPLSQGEKIPPKLWLNLKAFQEQYEIEPWQFAHVKGLCGDTSDGYWTVKGLGETFALKMIRQCGTMQEVEKQLDSLQISRMPEKVRVGLRENFETAYRNLKLADLHHTPEVELEIFGVDGISYLKENLENFGNPNSPDVHEVKEWLLECGKVAVAEKASFWLQPFAGRF